MIYQIKIYGSTKFLRATKQTKDMLAFLGQFETCYEAELNTKRPKLITDETIVVYEKFSQDRDYIRAMILGLEKSKI